MKYLTLLITILSFKSFAATYYVSNAGSDANNGLTPATSWQTLAKVNNTATSGDTVKLKCNDTWAVTTRLIPASNNIYYTSYSTGVKPLITGFVSATVGSPTANVYTINVPDAVADLKTVLINGKLAIKARYPNSTYLTYSASTANTLTTSLTGTPDYTGKEIVVRSAHWIIDVTKVASQSTGTLTLSPAPTYDGDAFGANGYFFQNDESFLDSLNEFSYDSVNKVLKVYATSTPTVQYSTVDTLVWVRNKTGITVDGIAFTGANKAVFQLDTCSYINIQNSKIENNGTNAIVIKGGTHPTIANDSILNTPNNAIMTTKNNSAPYVTDITTAVTITGNYIKNTGLYTGMGVSNNNQYFAINICADSSLINLNTIDSSGYIPLMWNGRVSTIEKNYIINYCFTKDDGGGIYTVNGSPVYYSRSGGSIVRNNIIGHGIGALAGTFGTTFSGASVGIYLDDYADSITVEDNTTFDTYYASINLRTAKVITIRGNTFDDSTGMNLYSAMNQFNTFQINVKSNIFYQRNSSSYTTNFATGSFSSCDSNYYLRPTAPTGMIRASGVDYTFPAYVTATGFDTNGGTNPGFYSSGIGVLYANPTNAAVKYTFSGVKVNARNEKFVNSVIVQPYASELLFPSSLTATTLQNINISGIR